MEARRQAESEDGQELLQNDSGLGSDEFKTLMLAQMEEKLSENHSGELWYQTAEAKAERIIAEELRPLTWTESDLVLRRKSDPAKRALASRLRSETILPMTWIARRLHLGTAKSARPRLRTWQRQERASSSSARKPRSPNQDDTTEEMNVALV